VKKKKEIIILFGINFKTSNARNENVYTIIMKLRTPSILSNNYFRMFLVITANYNSHY